MVGLVRANDMIVYNNNVKKVQAQELISQYPSIQYSRIPMSSAQSLVGALGADAVDRGCFVLLCVP
jgi:hypothetical protein